MITEFHFTQKQFFSVNWIIDLMIVNILFDFLCRVTFEDRVFFVSEMLPTKKEWKKIILNKQSTTILMHTQTLWLSVCSLVLNSSTMVEWWVYCAFSLLTLFFSTRQFCFSFISTNTFAATEWLASFATLRNYHSGVCVCLSACLCVGVC